MNSDCIIQGSRLATLPPPDNAYEVLLMNCKCLDSIKISFSGFCSSFETDLFYEFYFAGSMQLEVYYTVVVIWFFHHTWSSLLFLSGVIRNMARKGIYPSMILFGLGVAMCTCKLPIHTNYFLLITTDL